MCVRYTTLQILKLEGQQLPHFYILRIPHGDKKARNLFWVQSLKTSYFSTDAKIIGIYKQKSTGCNKKCKTQPGVKNIYKKNSANLNLSSVYLVTSECMLAKPI